MGLLPFSQIKKKYLYYNHNPRIVSLQKKYYNVFNPSVWYSNFSCKNTYKQPFNLCMIPLETRTLFLSEEVHSLLEWP